MEGEEINEILAKLTNMTAEQVKQVLTFVTELSAPRPTEPPREPRAAEGDDPGPTPAAPKHDDKSKEPIWQRKK